MSALARIEADASPTLNPALRPFWQAAKNAQGEPIRIRVLYGGRSSSKSWDAAGFAIFLAQAFTVKILCARQFQNKIDESVYTLLVATIDRYGLRDQFRILENKIIHRRTGSEFIFYGLWRHINEIKSLEGVDICWLEEAHALTLTQWQILEPTVRKEGSQFWLVFNPMLSSDFVWRRFVVKPPPGTISRLINYTENPFLSETMRRVIDAAKEEDETDYTHIYLGVPRDDDEGAVIKRSWVMAAIDAHKALGIEPTGRSQIGFDVADDGPDKCALIHAYGPLATWADMWKASEDELLKSATRAWSAAVERKASLIYDSIGVGAGVGGKVNELNGSGGIVTHTGFNAGGAVDRPEEIYARSHPPKKNKDMFANTKAQAWWLIADRFRNTFNAVKKGQKFPPDELIFLSSDMDHLQLLIDELCTPKRDFDNAGKVKVESKKDLAKPNREGGAQPSPNLADAFVMAFVNRSPGMQRIGISGI
jgi:phage terminase large subunit